MSRLSSLIRFAVIAIGFFLLVPNVQAAVILSEIQVSGDKAADEFVELYNTGDEPVSLKDYSLRRKSAGDVTTKGSSLKTFGGSDTVPVHGYFLWASSSGIFKDHADTTTSGGLSDNNSLGLFDKDGNLIDALTWGNSHVLPFTPASFDNPEKQESLERDLNDLSWAKAQKSSPTNSKGEVWEEEVSPLPEPKPLKQIVINEVFPNPDTKGDTGEFIELYNPQPETVDLSGWEIHDASTTGKYVFPSEKKIEPLGYLVITDKDFSLSLNNSNETLTLLDTEKRVVHSVHYDKTKEGVTLNLVGDKLRGGKIPTPGKENLLNSDPVTKEKVPSKGYRDIPVEFSAKGKDSDGDSLKYMWDFGDGHKSYKRETKHTYQETGKYTITLTTDDGTDTTTETFMLKIEKYEAPKLRIVALMPNPKGKDSDFEWIEIENREKKPVDLLGFSIATGAKKKSLVNHPIRESVIIKGKSTLRLSRTHSLFVLNNKAGHIELRAPNGKTIHALKYKFDKNLADNVVLKKEKGQPLSIEQLLDAGENDTPVVLQGESDSLSPPLAPPAPEEDLAPAHEPAPPEVKGEAILLEDNPLPRPLTPPLTPQRTWYNQLNEWLNAWLNRKGLLGLGSLF